MHLKYKNDWDFLNDNSLEGPFDNLAEQIQKIGLRILIILLIVLILVIFIKKYRK